MIKKIITLSLLLSSIYSLAQQTGKWGKQSEVMYRNPILPADYSDPDVIRVGDDYYLISSTLQMAPGMAVLHSKDLVNWETISHAVNDLTQLGPELNWDRMNRYNEGVYAGSIRYHKGIFYIHFTSFLEGFFVATSTNATGPWKVQPMKDKNGTPLLVAGWDDPCPYWEEDGKAYLVASKPKGEWYPHLFQLSEDGVTLLDADLDSMLPEKTPEAGNGTILYAKTTSEGNKIFKRNDYYYHYHNEVIGEVRVAMMKRSKNIYGTKTDGSAGKPGDPGEFDVKQILFSSPENREPNQGGIVDTPDGKWYFLTQAGRGGFPDGRVCHLLPVKWIDDWPFPGQYDEQSGMGTMQWTAAMPVKTKSVYYPQGSDEFSTSVLHPNWQWNYQPRANKWSLTERKGYLRLHAFTPLVPGQFFKTANTLGQRYLNSDTVVVLVKIDIAGMMDGLDAGFTHFNGGLNYANIGITQTHHTRRLKYEEDGRIEFGINVPKEITSVWFRSSIGLQHSNQYEYSFDGKKFTVFGGAYLLKWGNYRGDHMGFYCYNTKKEAGYIDIDFFNYSFSNK